jgi:hypothetical protein
MSSTFPYSAVIVVGAGNTGLGMGYQADQTASNKGLVYLCGTDGHPGNTKSVIEAGSTISANDFRLELPAKADVKGGNLEQIMLGRMDSGCVLIIVNTTVDVHDDVAQRLHRCNLANTDIVGHPSLFLGHYLDICLDQDGVHAERRPDMFLIDVTVFACRARGATVTLTDKKNELELARYGGDVDDEQCARLAAFFQLPASGFHRTAPYEMLNNIANPWAHGWPMRELAPRIKAGEQGLLFYVSPSKEAHDKGDAVSEGVKRFADRHGLKIITLTGKARTMYRAEVWRDYHHFANASSAHNTIPAPGTDDVRLIWEEEDITAVQLECAERLNDTIPEVQELHDALHAYMEEHLPHRLGRRTTLAALGIGAEYRGQAFIARYNGTHDKTGLASTARAGGRATATSANPASLASLYPGFSTSDDKAKFKAFWDDLNRG